MDLTDLPDDIFLLITSYISPSDCIRSRRVSPKWLEAFKDPETCRLVLHQHYQRTREVRLALQTPDHRGSSTDWSATLSKVAGRYHFLKSGKPRCIEKLALARSVVKPSWCRYHPIAPWRRHLKFEDKKATFHYPEPLWTYDDGLLVFPCAELQKYVLYDLECGVFHPITFEPTGKIVRRLRLKDHVLIVEWCEKLAYHKLNELEDVCRHFATAYDVVPQGDSWMTVFRNEWKIHFLGFPLNTRDRFYSTHSKTHYGLYLWQPNRSAWGEDDPIEALVVWDISSPSEYRPSGDSTGRLRPDENIEGARVIRRLSFADLDFYRIRQRSMPTFRGLELDDNHVYVVEEDHRWLVGDQAGNTLPRLHMVKSVGIPFADGPAKQDECGANGDVNMSFCQKRTEERHPTLAPCWRHEEFPYLTITQAVDTAAGVRFCARHCFMLETLSINIKPSVQMSGPEYETSLKDDLWQQLLGVGLICGDERWLIGENGNQEIAVLHFDKDKVHRRELGSNGAFTEETTGKGISTSET